MADFGIYWKNFARESASGDWPCTRWFTNSERLVRQLAPGDRLWLIATGRACGMAESQMGYLVELFVVRRVEANPGSNPDYPRADVAYAISGDDTSCLRVDPPLLVDPLIRGEESGPGVSIGMVRQGPWRLKVEMAAQLLEHVQRERPALLAALTPRSNEGASR